MPVRTSDATWEGNLKEGKGSYQLGKGAYQGSYSFPSRFEEGEGTNPEELVAAAHAACFSMAFSNALDKEGHTPTRVHTVAKVHLEKGEGGFSIPKIDLQTVAEVPGIDDAKFQEVAKQAKEGCPISKLLAAAEISLDAKLSS
jgi:lipoyl-dependent peroxiredoxin